MWEKHRCRRPKIVGTTEGEVWVGGERLGEVDVKWLKDRLAVVSQQPTLFDTSVGENMGVWPQRRMRRRRRRM
jgi:ABC-type multidrug transport system fused ATPase/permease subunit